MEKAYTLHDFCTINDKEKQTIPYLNEQVEEGQAGNLILVSEALQERQLAAIADDISHLKKVKLVLLAGPSSSGKTSTSRRLCIQLMACRLHPVALSTDNWFVNRDKTPLDENGNKDYESIYSMDLEQFNADLQGLIDGREVELPFYNFTKGEREYRGEKLRLKDDMILIIEGIHALNPMLTAQIADSQKFRIYISTLTSISLDDHNWIPTRDNRLLRRIIRDYNKGAFSARQTIQQWPSVCDGEENWISPYQERADVMFNSALNIEFAVLRNHAEPILASVPRNCPEYSEAHRLLKFLHYFTAVSDKEIPPTSIMREFVGGSSFKY